MPRIQQLPTSVVTQIAAGEVIERPASVLKELLENSIDAGSTHVTVEVEQGGTGLIRVVDDGCGIAPDDLILAFAPHATSKLQTADDLFRVGTFGFRGEALASVGGVAQVTLQSRPPGENCGAEVTCHGGVLSGPRPWNGAPGTRVEVRHLFYTTPVRRKFLRGPGVEMGHVSEVFLRLALSRHVPHLTLRHNGKPVYDVPLSADLFDRVALFFGKEVCDRLYPVEASEGAVTLEGYVADPACDRGGSGLVYLFVNGRWVRDRGLSQALHEAYRGLLMTGRHPVAFLYLDLPPDRVDVNVHPAKAEVRFRDPEAVSRLVLEGVRDRLRAEDLTAQMRGPGAPIRPQPSAARVTTGQTEGRPNVTVPAPPTPKVLPLFPPPDPPVDRPERGRALPSSTLPDVRPTNPRVEDATPRAGKGPEGRGQGGVKAVQMHELYLLVEVPEGILVIDQHALHERLLFERFKDQLRAGKVESQGLLVPETVNLPPAQAALVLEHREALANLGLGVEGFGGGTVLLTGYPAALSKRTPRGILQAVADYLGARERVPDRDQLFNDLLSLMACHAAVRAGDRLTQEEIDALVAQRHLAQDTHHCPHGRPTSLLFTRQNLDRQFRRV